jgi:hypothetical protein
LADYVVDALDSKDQFWHVTHFGEDEYLTGFVIADDVA